MKVNPKLRKYMNKYSRSIIFRAKQHARVLEKHLNPDEEVLYVFGGQKSYEFNIFFNSCVVAVTNKRIIIGQKRLFWGYFFTSITPDIYTDLKVKKGMIWSTIEIDTVTENVFIAYLDPRSAYETETFITEFMMSEKKKYAKEDN
jgi:hypothetical protein